jgi:hypothetical protein
MSEFFGIVIHMFYNLGIMINWDAIEAIGTVTAALVSLIIAIFHDSLRALHRRPDLDVSINVAPPDCHKTSMHCQLQQPYASTTTVYPSSSRSEPTSYTSTSTSSTFFEKDVAAYYLRLRIVNSGNKRAESVEVFAAELSKQQEDGTFGVEESFLPMNLLWSYDRRVFLPAISPHTYKHCDLAHILNPTEREALAVEHEAWVEHKIWEGVPERKTILSFDTAVKPHTKSHLRPFGTYRLLIFVAAANAKPVRKTLEITLTGDWYEDEDTMLREGIDIRVVS